MTCSSAAPAADFYAATVTPTAKTKPLNKFKDSEAGCFARSAVLASTTRFICKSTDLCERLFCILPLLSHSAKHPGLGNHCLGTGDGDMRSANPVSEIRASVQPPAASGKCKAFGNPLARTAARTRDQ